MKVTTTNRYHNLGDTGLACHPLGFGSYRISQGNREHETALRAYLDRGGNLIDTSANYADGLSETLIGTVLRDHPREEVIVVTKGGYIQGQNMELAQRRNFPEVVYFGEGIWHCIHPEFLETQIQRSLERMGLQHVGYLSPSQSRILFDREGIPRRTDTARSRGVLPKDSRSLSLPREPGGLRRHPVVWNQLQQLRPAPVRANHDFGQPLPGRSSKHPTRAPFPHHPASDESL